MVTRNDVDVSVDPWNRSADIRALFRSQPRKPVLPIRIVIANRGTSTLRFSNTTVELRTAAGEILPLISEGEMNSRMFDDASASAALVTILTLGYGAPVAGAIMASAADVNRHNHDVTRRYSMAHILLDPGKVAFGFLYFDKSSATSLRRRSSTPIPVVMRITRIPRSGGEPLSFDIPFSLDP